MIPELISTRSEFLSGLIGKPWGAGAAGPDAWDCWHLARHIERALFGRDLPAVDVPEAPTWPWMIETIRDHAERAHWLEIPAEHFGVIVASDGALVLMARCDRPAHIGVWLAHERAVIHADGKIGVTLQSPLTLKTAGWVRLRFFEPVR